jgi:hypothetical protein
MLYTAAGITYLTTRTFSLLIRHPVGIDVYDRYAACEAEVCWASMRSPVPARSLFLLVVTSIFSHVLLAERVPTESGIVYGIAAQQQLTMDYYAPKGTGPHPAVILIHTAVS